MKKVAIFAFNEGCEEREKTLVDFLAKELKKYDWRPYEFQATRLKVMVKEAKFADKSIIVCDAESKSRINFCIIAKELYKENIKPILLITNSDSENADLELAEAELGDTWLTQESELMPYHLNFHNIYFSYRVMGVNVIPEVVKNNIDALLDRLDLYE